MNYQKLTELLEYIKKNPKFHRINLPPYIYDDIDIVKLGKIPKSYINHTIILECQAKNDKYMVSLQDKTLQIPPGIKYLIITGIAHLPCVLDFSTAVDLEYLELCDSVECNAKHQIQNWPPNLKYAILQNYEYPLNNLSAGLIYLNPGRNYDDELNNLPASLVYLEFSRYSNFDKSLDYLPIGLKYLIINESNFDQPLDNLPPGLEILKIGSDTYSHSLYSLPVTLKVFIFNIEIDSYEYGIQNLPESLEALMLYMSFDDLQNFYMGASARDGGSRDSYNYLLDARRELASSEMPDDINIATIDKIINKITLPNKLQSIGLRMYGVSKDIATKIISKLQDKYQGLKISKMKRCT